MDPIRFPRPLINKLLHEAQQAAEQEVCGLVGAREGRPASVYPVANVAEDDWASFTLDPEGRARAIAEMRQRGEDLFAVYHSHPHTPAAPSVHDLADSADPSVLRLIISLDVRGVLQLSGWRLTAGGLEPVEIGLCEPGEGD
jgi:proteasome lid subunit RPN8/RPN11